MRCLALLAVLLLPGLAHAEATCSPARLDLRLETGADKAAGKAAGTRRESLSVELADDPAERAQGLMFRTELAPGSGMLFVYDSPRRVQFWMKNTLIPLDMVFADRTGTVTRVHEGAVPGDLTPIDGGEGVQFVLEINAGLARKLGIAPGAVLRHPAIPAASAVWPCGG